MYAKSIRWRIQVWLALGLICILSGFGVTAYQLNRIHQLSQIDEGLERRVTALSADWREPKIPSNPPPAARNFEREGRKQPPPSSRAFDRPTDGPRGPLGERPPGERPPGERPPEGGRVPEGPGGPGGSSRPLRMSEATAAMFNEGETGRAYYQLWERTGVRFASSPNAPADIPLPVRQRSESATHHRLRETYREAYHFTERGQCVLVGISITGHQAETRRFAGWITAAAGAVLAVGLGVGWMIASRVIRPVAAIGAAAERISAGNLAERIDVADTDRELGELATVLNSTFARLEAAFAEQKRFTADASHELRTPLAVLIAEAQTTLARERTAAEYRATVEGCLETAQQMRRLTEHLLEFARFDAGQETLRRETVDLAEIARGAVEGIAPLAKTQGVRLEAALTAVIVHGDATRLARVVTNLLSNAIHYNRAGGEVRIETRRDGGSAVLIVSDNGIGIAAGDLPHIFERFYRADRARSRADGRSGLGLAICRTIVEAHSGAITATSELGAGTTVSVRLAAGG